MASSTMEASSTIKLILEQDGQPKQTATFELNKNRLRISTVLAKFGLQTLEVMEAGGPVVLDFADDNLSLRTFLPNSELRVCGVPREKGAGTSSAPLSQADIEATARKVFADEQQKHQHNLAQGAGTSSAPLLQADMEATVRKVFADEQQKQQLKSTQEAADRFHACARAVIYPGAMHSLFASLGALGQVLKAEPKGFQSGGIFRVLACVALLVVIGGAGVGTWRVAGAGAAGAMWVGLSTMSVADRSLEYLWYKRQLPLLGAAGLWCLIAVALGLLTLVQIVVFSIALTISCIVLFVLAGICWCLGRINCAQGGRQWCADKLERARELLRKVWKLSGGA